MLFNKTLKQFLALALLVVFAFSITPQKSVHDLLAKHIDPTSCSVHKDLPIEQVENTALHCSYDFQVATTPFVDYDFSIKIVTLLNAQPRNAQFEAKVISQDAIHSDSRGPPSFIC
jgi:hypothetical protein